MGSTMKRKGLRLLAMVLAIVMVIGLVPASAAKKKSVTVATKTELFTAMQQSDIGTITYKTDKSGKLTISAKAGSETKKLVIDAPNKKVTNKASFSSVVIKNAKSYTEKKSGNKIYASSKSTTLSIAAKKKATLVCNRKGATVTLTAGKKATVDVTLSKKTKLTVKGNKTAKVSITSKAKGSKVTASIPVIIDATKNMSVILEKGSENSSINKKNDKITVKVTNKSGKEPKITIGGKAVDEPTKAPTSTPKPTATPTPTPTSNSNSGDVIVGYPVDGGYSGGGYSGGGYSGGGSSSGGSGSTATPAPTNQYTVTNKTELDAKLAELVKNTTTDYTVVLKTNDTASIEIAEGKYTNITLVIDAPNVSVTNSATFKKIELKNISANTWTELGADNTISSSAVTTHIVIGIGGVNTIIEIENGVKNVIIENNGVGQSVSGVYVNTGANVAMSGSNHTGYFVNNQAENTTITTSVQITLRTKYNVAVQILAGGETSDIVLMAEGVKVSVTGLGIITISDYISGETYDITAERLADSTLVASQGKGQVSGKVLFADETPAEDTSIKAYYYQNSLDAAIATTPVAEVRADEDGYFEIGELDLCNYYLVYTLDGYRTVYRVLCLTSENVSVDETVLISSTSTAGFIKGTLVDAKTGKSINTAGITLKLRSGLGNVSGDVLATANTDSAGNYVFENVEAGNYTIQVTDDRRNSDGMYVRTDRNIYVAGNGEVEVLNITVNYQVVNSTEVIVGGEGELRFVLEWFGKKDTGSVPADLDSHLIGPTADSEGQFHIYCNDRLYEYDEDIYADIDVDDVAYEGPETTSVYISSDGVYHFYVYDFTDEGEQNNNRLSSSGALVTVFKGNRVLGVFSVPAGKIGTLWDVCTYDMNTNILTPINEVYYHPGESYNVGKTPAEILRDSAFSLYYVYDGDTYISNAYSYLYDHTMYISGENETLEDPKFYYRHGGTETEYIPVEGQDYTGIAKATFNGETIEFKVYYSQKVQVRITGESLINTSYRSIYEEYDEDDEDEEEILYYYTEIYGEDIPEALTIEFKPKNVEFTYEPVEGKDYIGIIHMSHKGESKDVLVFFILQTNAFNYVTVKDDALIRQYSRRISSSGKYENGVYTSFYYTTVYGEKALTSFSPTISFDNSDVTATYEPVSGKDYIGIIHATYKSFKRDIRVFYEIDTDAFDYVTIEAEGLVDVWSRSVNYDYDEYDGYNKYYYVKIYGENEPVNPVVTFDKEGVTYTYDATPGKGYIGTIHAVYGSFKRDIRVVYNFKTYAFDSLSFKADGIIRNSSVLYEKDHLDQILYYYVNVFGEEEPINPEVEFSNENVTATYEAVSGEEYIGIIHASYKDMKRDIRVYYEFDTNAFDYVSIYANGVTDDDELWVDWDEDEDENEYYYVELESVSPITDPVIKFGDYAVSATYETVTGEDYTGIIHADYKGIERDILVYVTIVDADNVSCVYSFEFDASGNLSKETIEYSYGSKQEYYYDSKGNVSKDIYTYSDGDTETYEYEYDSENRVVKKVYTDECDEVYTYEYEYDETTGEKTKVSETYPSGTVEIEEFDPETGKVSRRTYKYVDGTSSSTEYEYDAKGHQVKRTEVGTDGLTTIYEAKYDEETEKLLEETTTYSDGSKNSSVYTYDSLDRLIKRVTTKKDGLVETYEKEYDETTGYTIKEVTTNSDGSSYTREYDANSGYPTKYVGMYSDGSGYEYQYNPVNYYETVKSIDYYSDGTYSMTEYERNSEGRVIKETYTATNGDVKITETKYDESTGKITEKIVTNPDKSVITTVYAYDANGNNTERTTTGPDGLIEAYVAEYDESTGRIIKDTDTYSDGTEYIREYNSAGTVIKRITRLSSWDEVELPIFSDCSWWSDYEIVKTSTATSGAIKLEYNYENSMSGEYDTLIESVKLYDVINGEESLFVTALYEYDENAYIKKTVWTYACDNSRKEWVFDAEGNAVVTVYNSDGTVRETSTYNKYNY